ncbi:hypothetical protein [Streptomyces sp. NBC_00063]|uniref:hypothetical protein n=1 Tax=Streptomyces sp. NBC_00063 TaxID=2975638 RepID=UPI003D760632
MRQREEPIDDTAAHLGGEPVVGLRKNSRRSAPAVHADNTFYGSGEARGGA